MANSHETNFHTTEMAQDHAGLVDLTIRVFNRKFNTRLSLEPIDINPSTATENIRVAARTDKPLPESVLTSFFVALSAASLVQDTYRNELSQREIEIMFDVHHTAKIDPIRIINRGIDRKTTWGEVRGQLEAIMQSV